MHDRNVRNASNQFSFQLLTENFYLTPFLGHANLMSCGPEKGHTFIKRHHTKAKLYQEVKKDEAVPQLGRSVRPDGKQRARSPVWRGTQIVKSLQFGGFLLFGSLEAFP
jgi:hypothetical protein